MNAKKKNAKRVTNHPNYIVGEDREKNTFFGMRLTSKEDKRHGSIKLTSNSLKSKNHWESYLSKFIEETDKGKFGGVNRNLFLNGKDKKKVDKYLKEVQKKNDNKSNSNWMRPFIEFNEAYEVNSSAVL